jgi:large subunit ribosomal protein L24
MGIYKSIDKRANPIHVRRDDEVIVISGDDKGKRGKVRAVSRKEGKLMVSGVNVVSKHVKPRRQGQPGGIIKTEGAIYACKVQLYCSRCGKGVRIKQLIGDDKSKVRLCAKCGEEL